MNLPWWQPWKDKWNQKKNKKDIASEEAARRYYSTKLFLTFGAEHIYAVPTVRYDYKLLRQYTITKDLKEFR